MAAGDTSLTICSDALLMLGAKPISSFDEGTDEASVANRLYSDIRDQSLAMYPWSFSFKKTSIARLITSTNTNISYQEIV
jgi:hypothetical protein